LNAENDIEQFNTDAAKGLNQTEVEGNRKEYGYNEVHENNSKNTYLVSYLFSVIHNR
jgi:hypothetical protein